MEYTITIETLHTAAATARSAGEQAGAVALGNASEALAEAMPGGSTASAAQQLTERWSTRLTRWCEDVVEHGTALETSAATYQDGEDTARDDLILAGDRLPDGGR
ncbi:hypothetical protein [Actinoalloteichus hymeniacidonis]|uniref:Excreted virulence factor EspC, type VII ESX diderm n=1 Tax=Actinoalloteichus hymeniacidonis TaxID=340345 RepID=A0AAC9HN16_9PSEU|nr:hypothetical protein [Actinoalloteichus hymeniacidonis]AOS61731.1 hypothetical protein TL08_04505 [Actinoalloteichus hymeniacidonis]MBB5910251.1 hypothetical protein [Actinoalloteichus hymeniacidonis]